MPNKSLKIHTLILFLICSTSCFGQKKIDSTYLTNYFTTIQTQALSDSLSNELVKLENKTPKKAKEFFYYEYAKFLLQRGAVDQSKKYIDKGLAIYQKDTSNFKAVKFYNLLGATYTMVNDYPSAVKLFNKLIIIAEKNKEYKQVAYLNNNLANIFFTLHDYSAAYEYGNKAWSYLKDKPDDPFRQKMQAVLSVAEAKIGKVKIAEKHAKEALAISLEKNDIQSVILAKYALGVIYSAANDHENAVKNFEESLESSDKINYFQISMLNAIELNNSYNALRNYEKAIEYGEKGLVIANLLKNENTIYAIKKNLAVAYGAYGDPKKAFKYMSEAHTIFEKTTNSETQKKVNDILIKYDTEKKEKELIQKNVEILQKDLKNGRFVQIITLLIFGLIVILFFFFYQRFKSQQKAIQLAAENEKNTLNALMKGEEEERTRIATELHDGLASNLTAAKFKLENLDVSPSSQKSELMELLRSTHEETRRIAHNLSPLAIEKFGFVGALKMLSDEFSSSKCSVDCNFTGDISILPSEKALIVYRFTQEIVQNALKHAQASKISVNIFCHDDELQLMAEDNGVGFDLAEANKNGGLSGLTKRVYHLKGRIEIDSTKNQGTVIHISIPNAQ